MSALDLHVVRRSIDHPDAALLVEAVQGEYVARYGSRDESPVRPGDFDPPHGAFYVGYLGDVPVATAAWRATSVVRLGERALEVKRMYVVPAAQRQGVASALLSRVEADAVAQGADHLVLETGLMQPEAIALYSARGYERVAGFGHYCGSELSRCYGRRLVPDPPP